MHQANNILLNALTIDVEDWFHPEWVRGHVDGHLVEKRALMAILPILGLLDRYRVKATFFISYQNISLHRVLKTGVPRGSRN